MPEVNANGQPPMLIHYITYLTNHLDACCISTVHCAQMSAQSFPEIRDSVRARCRRSPGESWRRLDAAREYPAKFVRALTQAGFLSVLIYIS